MNFSVPCWVFCFQTESRKKVTIVTSNSWFFNFSHLYLYLSNSNISLCVQTTFFASKSGMSKKNEKEKLASLKTLLYLICSLLSRALYSEYPSLLRVNNSLWRKIDFWLLLGDFGFNPFNKSNSLNKRMSLNAIFKMCTKKHEFILNRRVWLGLKN